MNKFISEETKLYFIDLIRGGKFEHEKVIAALEVYLTDKLMEMGRPDLYRQHIFTLKEINLIKEIKDNYSLESTLLHLEDLAQKLYEERIYKLLQLRPPFSMEEGNFTLAKERIQNLLFSLSGESTDKAKFIEIAAYAISCYRGMYKRDSLTAANLDWSDSTKYEETLKRQRDLQSPNFYFEYRNIK